MVSDDHFMEGEAELEVRPRAKCKQGGEANTSSVNNSGDDGSSGDVSHSPRSFADVPHAGMVALQDSSSGIIGARSRLQVSHTL